MQKCINRNTIWKKKKKAHKLKTKMHMIVKKNFKLDFRDSKLLETLPKVVRYWHCQWESLWQDKTYSNSFVACKKRHKKN
jgi:hypothetical protein